MLHDSWLIALGIDPRVIRVWEIELGRLVGVCEEGSTGGGVARYR